MVAGGRVHIVAPAGPVPAERLEKGIRVLRRCIDVECVRSANIHDQSGYFAGDDRTRVAALHEAFRDPEATAIICARGGYGLTRILGSLDPELLRRHPKVVIGFSDITALLCWVSSRVGLHSIHGPVATQLSTLSQRDVDRLVGMALGEIPAPLEATEGTTVHGGKVTGTLVAGNLEVLRSLLGTRFFPALDGTILAIEEVGERPYRIDRTLTQLLSAGALRGVRGIAVGQLMTPSESNDVGPTATEVVVERLSTLGIPVVLGFGFGHDEFHNAAIPFGTPAELDADNGTLTCLEPVTAQPPS